MTTKLGKLRTALCFAFVSIAGLAFATPSNAGVLVGTATDCNSYILEQPFVRWADPANYTLAPQGTFEHGTREWQLTGGARVVRDNERYFVHRRGETRALWLPAGSSATTRAMCAGIGEPTLRFFARNARGNLSQLQVEVLFEDSLGQVLALPIGAALSASSRWEPTLPLPVVANLLPLLPDQRTAIAFRFTPLDDSGAWRIDDVYLDPYRSR
jgi:hypothetical protein